MLTSVTTIPDLKLGVFILTNTANDGDAVMISVSRTIIDSYLGLNCIGWIDIDIFSKGTQSRTSHTDSVVTKVWQTVTAAKNTKVNPADYSGTYEDKWFVGLKFS